MNYTKKQKLIALKEMLKRNFISNEVYFELTKDENLSNEAFKKMINLYSNIYFDKEDLRLKNVISFIDNNSLTNEDCIILCSILISGMIDNSGISADDIFGMINDRVDFALCKADLNN